VGTSAHPSHRINDDSKYIELLKRLIADFDAHDA
jgi:hypothetical protein